MAMTKQEMFDKACEGLAAQGWQKSRALNGAACLYRGPYGLKCAVGHIIPDEIYDPKWDAYIGSIQEVCEASSDVAALIGSEIEFAREMQRAHDTADEGSMRGRFILLAEKHGLALPPCLREAL